MSFFKNWLEGRKARRGSPPKIVGLVPARNEGRKIAFCLQALGLYTDAIVYLDDCSDDGITLDLVKSLKTQCKIERIIVKNEWYRDEPGDRNRLLEAGREIGGTHFVVLDADEAFTANCTENGFLRKAILSLKPGEQLKMQWLQLWRSVHNYRDDDSSWSNKYKRIIFCDNGTSQYKSDFIHTSRIPGKLKGRRRQIDGPEYGLLHFQFVNWENLEIKQAWYRHLERIRLPNKPAGEIMKKYAPSEDETGLVVKPSPREWFAGYSFFDETLFGEADEWRRQQMRDWTNAYGSRYFSGLRASSGGSCGTGKR